MFKSLGNTSKFFNNSEDEAIHLALASVLYHFISVDQAVSSNEVERFSSLLQEEFDLSEEQVAHLYQSAKTSSTDFHADLKTIDHFLKNNPMIRMGFMGKLKRLIGVDGVLDCEMEAFN